MKEEQEFRTHTSRTYTIGVFSPVVGGFYFGKTLSGIARVAKHQGHHITAVQTFEADLDRTRFPENSQHNGLPSIRHLDGEIVITSALDPHAFEQLRTRNRPLVCVGRSMPGVDVPTVSPDNKGGVRAAVEHLIWHGHTKIGFVGNPQQSDVQERFDAYRETLEKHNIKFNENWVIPASDNQEGSGLAAGKVWIDRSVQTTATFVATDRNAIGFMHALREHGLSLPGDHAIIAFDHSEIGSRIRPRLSTVDPHHDRVGELAVKLLLSQLAQEPVAHKIHLSNSTLVTRESCGCVEALQQGSVIEGVLRPDETSAFDELAKAAELVFSGSVSGAPARSLHVGAWVTTITEIVRAATARALTPSAAVLARIADATTALQPHPEALETLLMVLRKLENECLELQANRPITYHAALRTTMTRISIAMTKGCTRALLNRSGALERTLANQYEIDLALMRVDASNPRTLSWLPASFKGGAALALWSGREMGDSGRQLEIVGARGIGSTGSRLVGSLVHAQEFPPTSLTRALSGKQQDILFIIPVTFAGSDWGLLAISGSTDTRSTSARDRFNHWAAMLAVALDHEKLLTDLREQRAHLQELAAKRTELTQAVRESEERFALATAATYEGMWDWDVLTGKVYYSPQWCRSLGLAAAEIEPTLDSWTGRVHPEDQTLMQVAIAKQLAGIDEPFHLEQRIKDSSGSYLNIQVRGLTLTNDAGIPARIVGSISLIAQQTPHISFSREPDNGMVCQVVEYLGGEESSDQNAFHNELTEQAGTMQSRSTA